jgi:N-sulfoglucosamine sulfohydrolase
MNASGNSLFPRAAIIVVVGALVTIFSISILYTMVAEEQPAPEQIKMLVKRPNFLLILSDDQSWQHTSFENYPLVNTPNFDRIANEGVYFSNTYAPAPTCTGSRSAILAGQPVWRLGSSSMLYSYYSEQMISYQSILERAGYHVGYSGKGWDPGRVPATAGLSHPPTGVAFNGIRQNAGSHLGKIDLAANFEKFLNETPRGQAFSFWAGSTEPHRPYKHSRNRFSKPEDAKHIPAFLPNTIRVQEDLSGYLDEVEIFDRDIGKLLKILEDRQLLENTVVIATSDNGMPFSRAKTNNYVHGVRVPFSVRWGDITKTGRVVDDFVNLSDIAPTLLELADAEIPEAMTANSFAYALLSHQSGLIDDSRDKTYSAFERHVGYIRGGEQNLTYPRRAIHTSDFLYIKNYFPNRWPAGDPPGYREAYPFLLVDPGTKKPLAPYFDQATRKRPMEELYDLGADPAQLVNIAEQAEYADKKNSLANQLKQHLIQTEDPLELTGRDVFSEYEYLGRRE